MLLANFNGKEHLRHRAVSLRKHGFLVRCRLNNTCDVSKGELWRLRHAQRPSGLFTWLTWLIHLWTASTKLPAYLSLNNFPSFSHILSLWSFLNVYRRILTSSKPFAVLLLTKLGWLGLFPSLRSHYHRRLTSFLTSRQLIVSPFLYTSFNRTPHEKLPHHDTKIFTSLQNISDARSMA